MARAMELTGSPASATTEGRRAEVMAVPRSPLYQAYQVAHWGFTALPVIAGLDKFASMLTNWNQYLAPQIGSFVVNHTPFTVSQVMMGVGAVEVLAGLLVALRPRIGAFVVAGWLAAIVVNLGMGAHFFDIALRDIGLMLSALTLGMLARHFDRRTVNEEEVEKEERRPMWRHRDDDVITR